MRSQRGAPECDPVLVDEALEVSGASLEEGRTAAQAIAGDLAQLFASFSRGEPDARFVRTISRALFAADEVARFTDPSPERPLCVRRILSLRYPGPRERHYARVGVEIGRAGRAERDRMELEVWAGDAANGFAWRLDLGRAARDYAELERLDRARAFLVAHLDAQIEHTGDRDVQLTWLSRPLAPATLCLSIRGEDGAGGEWTPPDATRCFEAPWTEPPRASVRPIVARGDGDEPPRGWYACLRSPASPRGGWLLDWPSGVLRGGTCTDGPDESPPPSLALPPVPVVEGLDALDGVAIDALDPSLVALSGRAHHLLCARIEGALACHAPPRQHLWVRWGDPTASPVDGGGRWIAVTREREEEPGASVRAGDRAAFLFRVEDGALTPYAVLPLGGFASERGGVTYEGGRMRYLWQTRDTRARVGRVGAGGCVEVTRRRTEGTPPTDRPDRLSGRDRPDVYGATDLDTTGAWMPAPSGGFVRAPTCPPP